MTASASWKPDVRLLWTAYAVAALSFATTLMLPYIGEEGIYTITAMEMKARELSARTTEACGKQPARRSAWSSGKSGS